MAIHSANAKTTKVLNTPNVENLSPTSSTLKGQSRTEHAIKTSSAMCAKTWLNATDVSNGNELLLSALQKENAWAHVKNVWAYRAQHVEKQKSPTSSRDLAWETIWHWDKMCVALTAILKEKGQKLVLLNWIIKTWKFAALARFLSLLFRPIERSGTFTATGAKTVKSLIVLLVRKM